MKRVKGNIFGSIYINYGVLHGNYQHSYSIFENWDPIPGTFNESQDLRPETHHMGETRDPKDGTRDPGHLFYVGPETRDPGN